MVVFGDSNVHHKDWSTYSGRTERPGELCYNFSVSNDLTQMVNFSSEIRDCDFHSHALFDLFLFLHLFSLFGFPTIRKLCMLCSQFPLTFHHIHNGIPCFMALLMTILVLIGMDYLRDVPWEDIFKLSVSAAGIEFCEGVRVGIDLYIPHGKYQVKPHSFSWFNSCLCCCHSS